MKSLKSFPNGSCHTNDLPLSEFCRHFLADLNPSSLQPKQNQCFANSLLRKHCLIVLITTFDIFSCRKQGNEIIKKQQRKYLQKILAKWK